MRVLYKPLTEDYEWSWLVQRASPIRCQDTQGIVAYDERGLILAICAMDSWTADACSVHFAIDKPMVIRRGFLNEVARYLFLDRGRKRIFGLIPANNDRAHKLDLHIGFREVARVPHGFREGVDYIVVCMEKDECRWLDEPEMDADHIKALRAA